MKKSPISFEVPKKRVSVFENNATVAYIHEALRGTARFTLTSQYIYSYT